MDTLHCALFSLLQRKIGDSSKFECAEFKFELENFVSPTIFKKNDMKKVWTNRILLWLVMQLIKDTRQQLNKDQNYHTIGRKKA